jgi:hypothetical protein
MGTPSIRKGDTGTIVNVSTLLKEGGVAGPWVETDKFNEGLEFEEGVFKGRSILQLGKDIGEDPDEYIEEEKEKKSRKILSFKNFLR